MSEEETRRKIEGALRDQASVEIPLIGKQQLVSDGFINKYAKPVAAWISQLWASIQQFFGGMLDKIYKAWDPEGYARAETEAAAKTAAAERERAHTEALTKKITDDIQRDTGNAVTDAVRGVIAEMITKGRIKHDNVDTIVAATDGTTWNQILPKLGADVSLRAETAATGSYKVQLDLPGGRQENYNTRTAAN